MRASKSIRCSRKPASRRSSIMQTKAVQAESQDREVPAVPAADASARSADRNGVPIRSRPLLQPDRLLAAISQAIPLHLAGQLHRPVQPAAVHPRPGVHHRLHTGVSRDPGRVGTCRGAVPARTHPRAQSDACDDADAVDDSPRDRRAYVEDHDGFERRRYPELRAIVHWHRPGELARARRTRR